MALNEKIPFIVKYHPWFHIYSITGRLFITRNISAGFRKNLEKSGSQNQNSCINYSENIFIYQERACIEWKRSFYKKGCEEYE